MLIRKLGMLHLCCTRKLGKEMVMNNEKILEAARKNKNRGKEFEQNESIRSSLWGLIAASVVGFIITLIDYFINGNLNMEVVAIIMTASGIQSLLEGIKIKKIHQIVYGVIGTLIALIAIIMFIRQAVLQ